MWLWGRRRPTWTNRLQKSWVHVAWQVAPTSAEGDGCCHCKATLDYLWTTMVLEDWKRANVTPVLKKEKKKDLVNHRWVSFTSVSWKIRIELLLETISATIRTSRWLGVVSKDLQNRKSCVANLIVFNNEVISLMEESSECCLPWF